MAYDVLVGLFLRTVESAGMRFVLWQDLQEPKKTPEDLRVFTHEIWQEFGITIHDVSKIQQQDVSKKKLGRWVRMFFDLYG